MDDAFVIKGMTGETEADFAMRWRMAFDIYVPIPLTPEIDY